MSGNLVVITDDHRERVGRVIEDSTALNTKRAYATGWRFFQHWASKHGYPSLPATSEVLASFVADLEEQGYSPSTVSVYYSAVIAAHEQIGQADALRTAGLKRTMKGIARRQRGYSPVKARALSADEILSLSRVCLDDPSLAGIRDRWALLVGVSLGLRYSDLAAIRLRDITRVEGKGYEILIPFSKTDKEGAGVVLPVPRLSAELAELCAARATDDLLEALTGGSAASGSDRDAPVLRGLHKGGRTWREGALTANGMRTALVKRAVLAGVNAQELTNHSLRASFATGAFDAGVAEDKIASVGRWASLREMRGYNRASRWHSPASEWLARAMEG